jgi:anti-sigma-K factor RskA
MPDSHVDDEQGLLELAYPYALDAVSEDERAEIGDRLAAAAARTARTFSSIVADTQETMALVTAGDAVDPPPQLRERVLQATEASAHQDAADDLAARRARRRRLITMAAAAAIVIGVASTVVVRSFDRSPAPAALSVAQVLANPDVRTISTAVAGGTITLSASAAANAVVVKMPNVPPPPAGHVYQMWFVPASGTARSAGTMGADSMPPVGGEVIPALDSATAVAVTVEPGSGSSQPTSTPIVTISLV